MGGLPRLQTESDPERIGLHFWGIRNHVYLAKRGKSALRRSLAVLRRLASVRHCLRARPYPLRKACVHVRGVLAGAFFSPKIEMVQTEERAGND